MLRKAAFVILVVALLAGLMMLIPQWRTGRVELEPLALQPGDRFVKPSRRIWIDTDAACGTGPRTDPDDCFAILLLARDPGLEIAGVSTVFGNGSLDVADRTVRELLLAMRIPPSVVAVHAGFAEPQAGAGQVAAVAALQLALGKGPLTIVALAPLTNVAAALRDRPDLQRNVSRIIAVMGHRPGHLFHPTEGTSGAMFFGHGPIFRDLNFASDPLAAAHVLQTNLPVALIPYDAARTVELGGVDLDRMQARGGASAWVAQRARGWLDFWRDDIGRDGFYPFDLMAAIFATRPDLFRCARVGVHIDETAGSMLRFLRKPALLVTPADAAQSPDGVNGSALYCPGVSDDLRPWLMQRLGERSAQ